MKLTKEQKQKKKEQEQKKKQQEQRYLDHSQQVLIHNVGHHDLFCDLHKMTEN